MTRFALVGAAGFVAPRHLEAIKSVGGKLVAALDPHDAVGILDRYDRTTEFFTEEYRFERHLTKLKQGGAPIDWLVVCSPNYLHDRHIQLGLHAGARVICEKPLVMNPENLHYLQEIEREYTTTRGEQRVFTVLQLRHVRKLQSLWYDARRGKQAQVQLNYVTPRGKWYGRSWKGDTAKSGGILTNIGIHMLDLLLWIWGPGVTHAGLLETPTATRVVGDIVLERAYVKFELSVEGDKPLRELVVDGKRVEFTDGFESLHNRVYEETLAGRGHGIEDARPAVELAAQLRRG